MNEVAVATLTASVDETGTLQFRDKITHLGWQTRSILQRFHIGMIPLTNHDASSTPIDASRYA